MLPFRNFLIEKAGEGMQSNIRNVKTRGHIKNYILPYLSAEQKKNSANALGSELNDKDKKDFDLENHGDFHDPKAENTHFLASKHGNFTKGTPVKVTGLKMNGDTVTATTEAHGEMPISKLGKPEKLAKQNITSGGFKLENILQDNADPRFKAAGSSGEFSDFVAKDPESEITLRGKAVKKNESDNQPDFRGEAKSSKKGSVAMGTISASYNTKIKKWEYSKKTKSQMRSKFEEATHPNSGLSIIDHLNKFHPNGDLETGFSVNAPKGTTTHYLGGLGVHALHLHRYAKDNDDNYTTNHGTTYTIGDNNEFEGGLGMGHLSTKELNKLDGSLTVERSGKGKIQIKHRPKPAVFNELADNSLKDPENHMNLADASGRDRFRFSFARHIRKLKAAPVEQRSGSVAVKNLETPKTLDHEATFAGKSYHSPDEQKHILGTA
jgi:hypothetical protein